jgi:hypothetical protein
MSKGQSIKVEIICVLCGKPFQAFPCHAKRGKRFCSLDCFALFRSIPIEEQFHKYLGPPTETGCILWTGRTSINGYGYIRYPSRHYQRKGTFAHRVAYRLAYGDFNEELLVCHKCDIHYPVGDRTYRRCCNPEHLFLGTHQDNMADMTSKDRAAKGSRSPKSKLTLENVRQARVAHATGRRCCDLAREYGVNWTTMDMALKGLTWKHA